MQDREQDGASAGALGPSTLGSVASVPVARAEGSLQDRALAAAARAAALTCVGAVVGALGGSSAVVEVVTLVGLVAALAFAFEGRADGPVGGALRLAGAVAVGLACGPLVGAWQRGGGDLDAGAAEVARALGQGAEFPWVAWLVTLLAGLGPTLVRSATSAPSLHVAAWTGAGATLGTWIASVGPPGAWAPWFVLAGGACAGAALVPVDRWLAARLPGLPAPPPGRDGARRLATWAVGVALLLGFAGAHARGTRPRPGAIGHHGETYVVGRLKTISTCAVLFREGDRDGDGALDYPASLHEVAAAGLASEALGRGLDVGYTFRLVRSAHGPDERWAAAADPLDPAGWRVFATDQTGTIYYTFDGPIVLDPDASLGARPGLRALGQ